jgi:NTE family protein
MGLNLMARGRRVEVMERARKTTALALRELRGTDQLMPGRKRARRGASGSGSRPAARARRGAASSRRAA